MRYLCPWLVAVFAGAVVLPPSPAAPPAPAPVNPEDEKILKAAKLDTEAPALLNHFKKQTLTAAEHDKISGLIKDLGNDAFQVRHKATVEIKKVGPAALPLLRRALNDPDEEVKERARDCIAELENPTRTTRNAAAARVLRARGSATEELAATLLAYLPDADSEAVEDEVLYTLAVLGVREGKVDAALAAALKDKQPARRAAAGLVLGRSGTGEQRASVQPLLADPDPWVRFRAAQGLLAARDRGGVPVLIALLGDGPAAVATRAEEVLSCLAGLRGPRVPFNEDPASRQQCKQAWTNWWRGQGRMDLTRADVDLPPFNPAMRAREATRQFLNAAIQGDNAEVKKMIDAPFVLLGERVLATRDEMEKFLDQNPINQRLPPAMPNVAGSGTLDDYLRMLSPEDRGLLARLRKGDIRMVQVHLNMEGIVRRRGGPGGAEEVVVLIRLTGEQPRVVGVGPNRAVRENP
jgi:hypothetical protein